MNLGGTPVSIQRIVLSSACTEDMIRTIRHGSTNRTVTPLISPVPLVSWTGAGVAMIRFIDAARLDAYIGNQSTHHEESPMSGAPAKSSAQTSQGRNVIDLIGNPPLIETSRLDTGLCRLFLKLESFNPGGSIKDRPALSMIEAFERDGSLKPGGTLIEATAGNTGLGLALVASQKGYRLILVIPDKMSREKIFHLKAMGAEIIMTRSDVGKGHPEYYQDMAERIARETPGAVYVNQFANWANPLAHETWTAPEIWAQMGHHVDAMVCGVGSGGTLTGLSRFFEKVSPKTEMVLADPDGSILADVVAGKTPREPGSWLVEGIGEDFIPDIADLSPVKKAYTVTDREAFEAARELLRAEGVLG